VTAAAREGPWLVARLWPADLDMIKGQVSAAAVGRPEGTKLSLHNLRVGDSVAVR